MDSNLVTAILVDGSKNPPALRIDKGERQRFISQGRAGQVPRNFQFVKAAELRVEDEDEPRTVFIYRLTGGKLSDDEFERQAAAEADKFLNPEKYSRTHENPDAQAAELAEYRRRFGPLTKEV